MKRFLGILVASMFLGSAGYAAEFDRKVGIVGEEKTADEKAKSAPAKGAPRPREKLATGKLASWAKRKRLRKRPNPLPPRVAPRPREKLATVKSAS